MIVTAVAVCSIDGFILPEEGGSVSDWSSPEDKEHFTQLIQNATGIVMGRKTWFGGKSYIELTPKTLRTVLTRNPAEYADEEVAGQLEFTDSSPAEIVELYKEAGNKELLILGGSEIYAMFLKDNLIDKFVLTIEPIIFGNGTKLFSEAVKKDLKLESVEKMNKQGTILVTYHLI